MTWTKKRIKGLVVLVISVMFLGCTSMRAPTLDNTASITEFNKDGEECAARPDNEDVGDELTEPTKRGSGVRFKTSSPTKMTMKKDKDGNVEYTFDSQAQSWLSKLIGALMGGLVGRR